MTDREAGSVHQNQDRRVMRRSVVLRVCCTVLLVSLIGCQTPRQQGWQETPTKSRLQRSPIVVVVWAWPFSFVVVRGIGHEVDQSGAVGGGETSGTQKSDQKTDVDADATVPIKP